MTTEAPTTALGTTSPDRERSGDDQGRVLMRIQQTTATGMAAEIREAAIELLPVLQGSSTSRCALAVSGSLSKSTSDELSDVDFRFYSDEPVDLDDPARQARWQSIRSNWADRGIVLDELWCRTVGEVDRTIDSWLDGDGVPDDLVWTVWGYHPLTDLSRQIAIIDDHGLVAAWRRRLEVYPERLRTAILERHLTPVRYWRRDYHYENKAVRGDVVFLAGLTSALVHHALQILAALNRSYYPGDGNNLVAAAGFAVAPPGLADRVTQILAPAGPVRDFIVQRERLVTLIDEVLDLVADHTTTGRHARGEERSS